MGKRQFHWANAKDPSGQGMQICKEPEKKKKDRSEYSKPRSGEDEIREVGGGQIRAFLGRDKNFILGEMESYLRLHNMYLPIWTAAFACR